MLDFSLITYKTLLKSLIEAKYSFLPFDEFLGKQIGNSIVLRHDVDNSAWNSLRIAHIENELGIKGIYFFRIVSQSNKPIIIKEICSFGNEIGYHYEDLTLCKGNIDEAIMDFQRNLQYFHQFYSIKFICMHGSPLSKYDNRKLWEKFDYHKFGILAEPYFDVDYTKVLYLTDTGRRWDGESVSVRDKVSKEFGAGIREKELTGKGSETIIGMTKDGRLKVWRDENRILKHNFHSTFDIIAAAKERILPDQIMITVHPQRWTNNFFLWSKEMIMQNVKNRVKKFFVD